MGKNPYPKTIIDESSGVEVANDEHRIWERGYQAGLKDRENMVKQKVRQKPKPRKKRL